MNDRPTVIADAGPLIALAKLHRLDLLDQIYGELRIPETVYEEAVVEGLARGHEDARLIQLTSRHHAWPIEEVPDKALSDYRPDCILGRGERHAIALARATPDALLLIDDELARTEARRLNLHVKGTLGILVEAHRHSHLTFDAFELLIEEIENRTDLWISSKLCQQVLAAVREAT